MKCPGRLYTGTRRSHTVPITSIPGFHWGSRWHCNTSVCSQDTAVQRVFSHPFSPLMLGRTGTLQLIEHSWKRHCGTSKAIIVTGNRTSLSLPALTLASEPPCCRETQATGRSPVQMLQPAVLGKLAVSLNGPSYKSTGSDSAPGTIPAEAKGDRGELSAPNPSPPADSWAEHLDRNQSKDP